MLNLKNSFFLLDVQQPAQVVSILSLLYQIFLELICIFSFFFSLGKRVWGIFFGYYIFDYSFCFICVDSFYSTEASITIIWGFYLLFSLYLLMLFELLFCLKISFSVVSILPCYLWFISQFCDNIISAGSSFYICAVIILSLSSYFIEGLFFLSHAVKESGSVVAQLYPTLCDLLGYCPARLLYP